MQVGFGEGATEVSARVAEAVRAIAAVHCTIFLLLSHLSTEKEDEEGDDAHENRFRNFGELYHPRQ